jgi:hypothetical protein
MPEPRPALKMLSAWVNQGEDSIMIQMAIIGLAILAAIAGAATLATGKISITRGSAVQGAAARSIGIGLLVLAAAMAGFALWILPRL